MPELFDIKEINRALGLNSKYGGRTRVYAIKDILKRSNALVLDPDKGGALSVTSEGMELLRRFHEKTKSGLTFGEAAEEMRVELGYAEASPSGHDLKLLKLEIDRRFGELEDRVKKLEQERLPWWARLMHVLPSPKRPVDTD